MVGRNAPCPCGSGKKYKRCCINTNEQFLEQQVSEELKQTIVEAYEQSADREDLAEFRQLMQEWKEKLEGHWQRNRIEEAISAYYLFVRRSDLWQRRLQLSLNDTLRTTVRKVLETWQMPIVLLGKIKGEQDGMLEIEQIYEDKTYYLKKVERMPNDPDTFVYGIVLPDHRQHPNGIYAVSSLMFTRDEKSMLEKQVFDLAKSNGVSVGVEFFKSYMVNIYEIFLGKSVAMKTSSMEERDELQAVETEQLTENEEQTTELPADLTPIQEETVTLLDRTLQEREADAAARERVKNICVTYLLEEQPNFRKANVVAAGVFRAALDCELLDEEPMTNNAVATLFDVSPASMTRHAENVRDLIPSLYAEAITGN